MFSSRSGFGCESKIKRDTSSCKQEAGVRRSHAPLAGNGTGSAAAALALRPQPGADAGSLADARRLGPLLPGPRAGGSAPAEAPVEAEGELTRRVKLSWFPRCGACVHS